MARGREGIGKRQREKRRQERKEAKQLRREAIAAETDRPDPREEAQLMEAFRLLSEKHAAGLIAETTFAVERHRILVQLGIENEDA